MAYRTGHVKHESQEVSLVSKSKESWQGAYGRTETAEKRTWRSATCSSEPASTAGTINGHDRPLAAGATGEASGLCGDNRKKDDVMQGAAFGHSAARSQELGDEPKGAASVPREAFEHVHHPGIAGLSEMARVGVSACRTRKTYFFGRTVAAERSVTEVSEGRRDVPEALCPSQKAREDGQ